MKTPERDVKRILVIEDEPGIGDLCQRVLTDEGFEADIAVNGKIAQDMIGEKQYDLLLLDIRMPVMTGEEFYQWLEEKHPQLISRVIFTSGSVVSGDTLRFMEQTGRPSLPKPFTPDELRNIINKTVQEIMK